MVLLFGCGKSEKEPVLIQKEYEVQKLISRNKTEFQIQNIWNEENAVYFLAHGKRVSSSYAVEDEYSIYSLSYKKISTQTRWEEALTNLEESLQIAKGKHYLEAYYGLDQELYLLEKKTGSVQLLNIYRLKDDGSYDTFHISDETQESDSTTVLVSKVGEIFLVLGSGAVRPYDSSLQKTLEDVEVGFRNVSSADFCLGSKYIYQLYYGTYYVWDIHEKVGYVKEIENSRVISNRGFFCVDCDDNLYLANDNGICRFLEGGSIWEVLVDEGEQYLDGNKYEIRNFYLVQDDFYLLVEDRETQEQIVITYQKREVQ